MEAEPVIHLVSFPLNGHVMSPASHDAHDCWCEPTNIFWIRNRYGVNVLVVEHNDYTQKHRHHQLAEQAAGIPESLAWINHVLYAPENYPTAALRDIKARSRPYEKGLE